MKRYKILFALVLITVLTILCIPAMSHAENLFTNGGFESGTEGWEFLRYGGESEELLLTLDPAVGDKYIALPDATILRQTAKAEPNVTYRLTFWIKSANANAIKLYLYYTRDGLIYDGTNFTDMENASYDPANAAVVAYANTRPTFGSGGNTWQEIVYDIPVPSDHVNGIRFDFWAQNDEGLCVDGFSLTKSDTCCNYVINGGFDGYSNNTVLAWRGSNTTDAETHEFAEVNDSLCYHFKQKEDNTVTVYMVQDVYLPSGRYALSFRAKSAAKSGTAYWALDAKPTTDRDLFTAMGTKTWWAVGTGLKDSWQTFTWHFTVPQDADGRDTVRTMSLYLPTPGNRNKSCESYFDDIALYADKNTLDFSQKTVATGTMMATIRTSDTTKLSDIGANGELCVNGHFVPTTVTAAQSASLLTALYKTDGNGAKQLMELSVKKGTSDIVSEDALGGKNARGLVALQDTLQLPKDLDESYSVTVYLWEKPGLGKAYARQTISY